MSGIFAVVAMACWSVAVAESPANPRAEFDDALGHLKKLVADMTVLQAQYQQPKADKAVITTRYEAAQKQAMTVAERVERAAISLLAVEPKDPAAREIAGGIVADALKFDDPAKALATADSLAAASVADGQIAMMAASAAMILSLPDTANAWLAKAKAAGVPAEQLAEIKGALTAARPKIEAEMAKRQADAEADDLPRVKLQTSAGDIVVELFENEAPNTVANFISLVEKGFYDNTPFHRVIQGFMAQGGDPTGTGSGGPGHTIKCECGRSDARMHFRGSLSMAHAGENTGGSQFFLTFRPTEHLDRKHTVFGRVIDGDGLLPKLARTQDEEGRSAPGVQPDRIVKATVLRKRDHAYVPETQPDGRPR